MRLLSLSSLFLSFINPNVVYAARDPLTYFFPAIPTLDNTTLCIAGYLSCATINRSDACCALSQVCSFTNASELACCEYPARCRGNLSDAIRDQSAGSHAIDVIWVRVGSVGLGIVVAVALGMGLG